MQDRKYLLSIEELLEDISRELEERCLSLLDEERLQRALASKGKQRMAENIGAGLLMQLAVREMSEQATGLPIMKFTLPELLSVLEAYNMPLLPLEYTYTRHGKPFLKNHPYYFNLSHSGNYVFCVISEQEVGADIQWKKSQAEERIIRRFFSEEEKAAWESCMSQEEKSNFFYRLWTRKEAYGKLTGEGIGAAIGQCVMHCDTETADITFEDYESDNYQIAVCKWK